MRDKRNYNKFITLYNKYTRDEIGYFNNLNNQMKNEIFQLENQIDEFTELNYQIVRERSR